MADPEREEEIEMLRRERDEAIRRAEAAEKKAGLAERAAGLGWPSELVAGMDPDLTDAQITAKVESLRDLCAKLTREELVARRPDRRRGNMLVQNGREGQRLALAPGTPDWLVERLNSEGA